MKKPKPPSQYILDKSVLAQIEKLAKEAPTKTAQNWTPKEIAILKAAYGRINMKVIKKKLLPHWSEAKIYAKIRELKLTRTYLLGNRYKKNSKS